MKQIITLLLCVGTLTSYSQKKIGAILVQPESNDYTQWNDSLAYHISVKNLSTEILTNISIATELEPPYFDITCQGSIAQLMPGEENTVALTAYERVFSGWDIEDCWLSRSFKVSATDASGQPTETYTSPDDYFNEYNSYFPFRFDFAEMNITTYYEDSNMNGLVDVGDGVHYYYAFVNQYSAGIYVGFPNYIMLDAVPDEPFTDMFGQQQSGSVILQSFGSGVERYHHLTAAEVAAGFVFHEPVFWTENNCTTVNVLSDCTDCPTPANCYNCVVTRLGTGNAPKASGTLKFDAGSGCVNGYGLECQKIMSTNGSNTFTTWTQANGDYMLHLPPGTHSVEPQLSSNPMFTVTPGSLSVQAPVWNTVYEGNDFCASASGPFNDLSVKIVPLDVAVPGFPSRYILYYTNVGSTALSGSLSLGYDEERIGALSSVPGFASDANGLATWTFSNLLPFERRKVIATFTVAVPPINNFGDNLAFTLTGAITEVDNDLSNNAKMLDQQVFNSFDPNDKTVVEGPTISAAQADDYLTYVTRFQNTGNFPATTVVIHENLDNDLDWSTFEPIDASHAYNVQLQDGALTWNFPNIGLVDSESNEPESHGWLSYRIKPKAGFTYGDVASSSSAIHFDYNPAIVTNTVYTTLESLGTDHSGRLDFYLAQNPVDSLLRFEGTAAKNASATVFDLQGRKMVSGATGENATLSVDHLAKGVYFVVLEKDGKTASIKFIKK